MGKVYVVEHMEPDEQGGPWSLPEWVLLEYFHILQRVGLCPDGKQEGSPSNSSASSLAVGTPPGAPKQPAGTKVIFSQLSVKSAEVLASHLNEKATEMSYPSLISNVLPAPSTPARLVLEHFNPCTCSSLSVLQLISALQIPKAQVCLLDPRAEQELEPADGQRFRWFLFGGILGDEPPRDRTAQLRNIGFPSRHLGPVQMTTDTAVATTKLVVEDGFFLRDLDWVEKPDLVFNSQETVQMPFRYLADSNRQPVMPAGMKELIRKDMDRPFEF